MFSAVIRSSKQREFVLGTLVLGLSALAAYLALRSPFPLPEVPIQAGAVSVPDPILSAVEPSPVSTDLGRTVPLLYRPAIRNYQPDPVLVGTQQQRLEALGLQGHVIQIATGWQDSNCHGWVFTGGKYWLDHSTIPLILQDNGYLQVFDPRPSDLAVYRTESGRIEHSGIVRFVSPGTILVESKWGYNGSRVLHLHDVHAFPGQTCTFYRSPRLGHLLQGVAPQTANVPSPNMLEPFLKSAH